MLIGQDILLVSPLRTLAVLGQLAGSGEFWQSVLHSFVKIAFGFLLAIAGGSLFALLSYKNRVVRELLYPLVTVIKATPVASFVILAPVSYTHLDVYKRQLYILAAILVPALYGGRTAMAAFIAASIAVLLAGRVLRRTLPILSFSFIVLITVVIIQGLFRAGNTTVAFALGPVVFYREGLSFALGIGLNVVKIPVSYTHLDVYKRQMLNRVVKYFAILREHRFVTYREGKE